MPTYLCHGFRWKRRAIRVYVVVQDLDDAAPEWIIKQGSARCLIESFYNLFAFLPDCTFPPTRSATPASRSRARSIPGSVDRASMMDGRTRDDSDTTTSFHTSRSSTNASRSRSRSTARTQQQRSQHFDDRDPNTPTGPPPARESSNSSRKRSWADLPRSRPVTGQTQLHHQGHAAPPSPPASSQPRRNFSTSQLSVDAAVVGDPVLSQAWSPVQLLEEHDPANLDEVSRPHAYVADYATRIDASCSIVEEIQRYESRVRHTADNPAITGPSSDEMLCGRGRDTTRLGRNAGWFEKLRDQLQQDEEIRWYVVVNGDEERAWPPAAEAAAAETLPERRTAALHHAQYTHQQLLFEGNDRELEARREQLRHELGYEKGGVDSLRERRLERREKPPEKELPPLTTKTSRDQTATASPKTPKTPGRASFKRLFLRSRPGEETLP